MHHNQDMGRIMVIHLPHHLLRAILLLVTPLLLIHHNKDIPLLLILHNKDIPLLVILGDK
jgi:hypothetical protein